MMGDVKLPVRVILCGTDYNGIKSPANAQCLDLAKKTGGSVHTIEKDLEDIAKTKEGNEVVLGVVTYTLRGGKFARK